GLQVLLDAPAKGGDRLVDRSAPLLLLLHRNAFAFRIASLGDVFVGCDPSAIGHRPVDDGNSPSLRRRDFGGGRLACGHGAEQAAPVFGWIAREALVVNAVLEQALE